MSTDFHTGVPFLSLVDLPKLKHLACSWRWERGVGGREVRHTEMLHGDGTYRQDYNTLYPAISLRKRINSCACTCTCTCSWQSSTWRPSRSWKTGHFRDWCCIRKGVWDVGHRILRRVNPSLRGIVRFEDGRLYVEWCLKTYWVVSLHECGGEKWGGGGGGYRRREFQRGKAGVRGDAGAGFRQPGLETSSHVPQLLRSCGRKCWAVSCSCREAECLVISLCQMESDRPSGMYQRFVWH
jgi:hypothetical protein